MTEENTEAKTNVRYLLRLLFLMLCCAAIWCRGETAMTTQPIEVRIDAGQVACRNFLGYGVEWDPEFWADYNLKLGVTEEDWQRIVARIRWMRVPIVRMMMLSKWCTPLGDGRFDWDSPDMRSLYRHLDVCQREGITVILTDWGCVVSWNRVPGFSGMGDPKYAEAIGTYLDHLIRGKGYTRIRYFILGNEPNLEGFGWDQWKTGVENVSRVFAQRKLDLVLTGSDQSNGDDWHRRAVDEMSHLFKAWDVHRYASVADVRSGELEKYLRAQWDHVAAKDPAAAAKPRIVAEAGMADGMVGASLNKNVDTHEYGVFQIDYATQAVRAGSSAVLAWMLDDSSHDGFLLGMWKNKAADFALRKWAYPWALLVRYVPAGSTIYAVRDPAPQVRILAAKRDEEWTFCVTNSSTSPLELRLQVPGDKELRLQRYCYSTDTAPVDADGMPVPVGKPTPLAPGTSLPMSCPAQSVTFATSMNR